MVEEAMPGNIRKAEHFIAFLRRFIEYLKVSDLMDDPINDRLVCECYMSLQKRRNRFWHI